MAQLVAEGASRSLAATPQVVEPLGEDGLSLVADQLGRLKGDLKKSLLARDALSLNPEGVGRLLAELIKGAAANGILFT
ncbi:hypothetical protein J8273_1824 [Carpediemonas membranifera]|uniref:Uncharacterized protein n=1 Tax=Carpediemonas membranifera TaxID=201153 RepID=A0A8J6BBF8_9EUKA|nr:hypothetical protein J8273_1824 [Carpediemonas membranifera]|eukprot:KAG9396782.1 hypothetical protein J8273_1824 [Carpediemonas membranifera]